MLCTHVTPAGEELSTACVLLTCEFFRSHLVAENKEDKLICLCSIKFSGLRILLSLPFFIGQGPDYELSKGTVAITCLGRFHK